MKQLKDWLRYLCCCECLYSQRNRESQATTSMTSISLGDGSVTSSTTVIQPGRDDAPTVRAKNSTKEISNEDEGEDEENSGRSFFSNPSAIQPSLSITILSTLYDMKLDAETAPTTKIKPPAIALQPSLWLAVEKTRVHLASKNIQKMTRAVSEPLLSDKYLRPLPTMRKQSF